MIVTIIEETFYKEPRGGGDERTLVRTDRPDDRVTLRLADPEHLNPLTA